MKEREKKYPSDYAYLAQRDRIIEKEIPWQDIDGMRNIIIQYTDLQNDLRDCDVEEEHIETLAELVKFLETEVANYDGQ